MLKGILPWVFTVLLMISSVASSQAKSVKLSWDASPTPTVTGYIVLSALNLNMLNPLLKDVGNVLNKTVVELNNEDDYYFCVKAYDSIGNKSICSNIVKSPKIPETVLPMLDYEVEINILH